ncbi:MAG: putative acetyltransferase [Frankiales bacterium]|nr:putative acetyltransferase [Frankiales bacterium]
MREVLPDEQSAVADLTAAVYRGEGYSSADYEPALRDVASRVRTATVLVAVSDDEPDGEALLGAVTVATGGGEWAEHATRGEAVVRMLVVAAAGRGRGTGETLVRACLDRARQAGCHLVRLSSQLDMHAAHRLYERLGFTRTPSLDWQPVPGLQLITYALPLAPFCDQCGEEQSGEGHERCRAARDLEPPRYCAHCRRRMVVQVHPTGWTARCVEHGERTSV